MHLFLLYDEILPVEHLDLGLVFALLQHAEYVADLLVNGILLVDELGLLVGKDDGQVGLRGV